MQEKNQASEQEANKITTDDIRKHILELKKAAKDAGKTFIILKSGDIHKELNLKSRMPQVCNAMRQSMNEGDIVFTPFMGIGSEQSIASAEEVAQAIMNQTELPAGHKALRVYCDEHGILLKDIWEEHALTKTSPNSLFYSVLAEVMKEQGE